MALTVIITVIVQSRKEFDLRILFFNLSKSVFFYKSANLHFVLKRWVLLVKNFRSVLLFNGKSSGEYFPFWKYSSHRLYLLKSTLWI